LLKRLLNPSEETILTHRTGALAAAQPEPDPPGGWPGGPDAVGTGAHPSGRALSCWWWWASSTPANRPLSTRCWASACWRRARLPTTSRVHRIHHGDQISRTLHEADLEVISAPVEWLRDLNIVDTPGANAVIQRHQEITEDFVPRSDLVLFVTSADRPFSESERLFMGRDAPVGQESGDRRQQGGHPGRRRHRPGARLCQLTTR
jgi:hypothetical protein